MKFTDAIKFAIGTTFLKICDTQSVEVAYCFGCFLTIIFNHLDLNQDIILYNHKGIYQEKIDFDPIVGDEIIIDCYFQHHSEEGQNVWDIVFESEGFSCNPRVKGDDVTNHSIDNIRPVIKMLTRYFKSAVYLPSRNCVIEE